MPALARRLSLLALFITVLGGCVSDGDGTPDGATADATADTQADAGDADEEAYERVQSCGYVLRDVVTDELVRNVHHELDGSGKLVRAQSLPTEGGDQVYETTYNYDELDRISSEVRDQAAPEDVVEVTSYVYDGDGPQATTRRRSSGPTVDDQTPQRSTEFIYGSAGYMESAEYYGPNGNLLGRLTVTWTEDYTVREAVRRDTDGEFVSSVETQFASDGRPLSRDFVLTIGEDQQFEQRQEMNYDDKNRLATVELFNGDGMLTLVYTYNYDCY